MLKPLTPPDQTFGDLASKQFFSVQGRPECIYCKILQEGKYNAIELKEDESNHGHSHHYYFQLATIADQVRVQHLEIVDIEITFRIV